MNLETYLVSKKIDSNAFSKAEPELWKAWNMEFETMHPNSFTVQKLNLINPIRRKYPLPATAAKKEGHTNNPASDDPSTQHSEANTGSPQNPKPLIPKPTTPKPVFKPKPKIS